MQANHVVIWLDHNEAHIIAFTRDAADKAVIIHAPIRREHQHHKADAVGSGKAAEHPDYYDAIVLKIRDIREWLIVGPANAKLAFLKHIAKAHHALNDHLSAWKRWTIRPTPSYSPMRASTLWLPTA